MVHIDVNITYRDINNSKFVQNLYLSNFGIKMLKFKYKFDDLYWNFYNNENTSRSSKGCKPHEVRGIPKSYLPQI